MTNCVGSLTRRWSNPTKEGGYASALTKFSACLYVLVEVCESIEQCAELSLINLRYCNNLEKLPTSLRKLKEVKTLLLDGCGLYEPPAEIRGMDSQEMVRAINSQELSCAIPCKLKFLYFLRSSLVRLSLKNYNLSNEPFPADFSYLSMLKELNLNGNPLISMPTCVRSLPRLEELSMSYNNLLVSVDHPPCTLKEMDIEEPEFWCTLYEGEAMPNWIRDRNKGPIISFTIPLSPKKLKGLNFCNVQTFRCHSYEYLKVPSIKISNVTKNVTWIYNRLILGAPMRNKSIIFLSHWMFGANEMEAGDQVTITVTQRTQHDRQLTECGISLVYDDDDDDDDVDDQHHDGGDDVDDGFLFDEVDLNVDDDGRMKEEDPSSYYKSWNHIIGKDLSALQSTIDRRIHTTKLAFFLGLIFSQ
ncbi:disease resistance protein RML1B-like protein [Tanacetum coccineum]|uniref:Disease resistance protein RML1B-like protein n=1 Tax=Tanacetum coccineum TaxID=301880 RepID=A0ABQ5E2B7_9ASTR